MEEKSQMIGIMKINRCRPIAKRSEEQMIKTAQSDDPASGTTDKSLDSNKGKSFDSDRGKSLGRA